MTPRRLLAAALAGLAALVAAASSLAFLATGEQMGAVAGAVWVANEGSGSLTVVDAGSNRVAARLTGVTAPHNVQAGNGSTILATSANGTVLQLESRYDLRWTGSAGRHPAHVIQLPRGDVWVTDELADAVVVFVAPSRRRTAVRVGDAPHGLRASPDGRRVLVANRGAGTVTLLDAQRRSVLAEIPVGREPVQVAFAPDGATAYVTLRGEDAVAAVDLEHHVVGGKVAVGRGPVQLAATPDGRHLVVANQGTPARPGRTASLVATAPFREVAEIAAGAGPHGVAVNPSGRRAYVTNLYGGTLSVLDLELRRELTEIPVGLRPNGVTFSPLDPVRAPRPVSLGAGGRGHRH